MGGRDLKAWVLKGQFERKGKEEARNTERIAEAEMHTGHIWAHVHCGTIVLKGILRKKMVLCALEKGFQPKVSLSHLFSSGYGYQSSDWEYIDKKKKKTSNLAPLH